MMNMHRQRGAALVIALVIVAIATILATTLVWENHLDRRRTANQLYGAEALANALAVEDLVRFLIAEDEPESDHLQEPWARQGDVFPIEGGVLSGSVIDLQGRFNVNNLVDTQGANAGEPNVEQVKAYGQLIRSLGLEESIINQTIDWIDPDIEPEGFDGAEDDTYLRETPAYRTANRPITDISELRLLAGMTEEQFNVLRPFITALPTTNGPTPVNINTAPPELLSALSDGLTPAHVAQLVEFREQAGYADLAQAFSQIGATVSPDEMDLFSVQSNYFRLRVLAVIGSSRVTMYSVLHRDAQTGMVLTLSRSLGTP